MDDNVAIATIIATAMAVFSLDSCAAVFSSVSVGGTLLTPPSLGMYPFSSSGGNFIFYVLSESYSGISGN